MMASDWDGGYQAKEAYDAIASSYNDFTQGYGYEYARWAGRLLGKAEDAGLGGNQLLDIACGTGLSFTPMLERGWQVTGCDISPAMLEIARSKVGDEVSLLAADMRDLPELGRFDLVWTLNDSINYMLSIEELEAALAGIRRNLAGEGIALFDANTLTTYRTFWSSETVREVDGRKLVWQGQASAEEVGPELLYEARFEAVGETGSGHMHRQRHFPRDQVLEAVEVAGLQCVSLFGELDGALHMDFDEDIHTKAVYLCRVRDGER